MYKTIRKQLTAPETVKWSTVPRDDGSSPKRQQREQQRCRCSVGSPDSRRLPRRRTVSPKVHSIEAQTSATRLRRQQSIPLYPGRFQTAPGSNETAHSSQTNSNDFLSSQTDCLTTDHKVINHTVDKQFSTLLHNEICIVRYPNRQTIG